ncbi:MAG: hypothetical protein COW42_00595, partial [Deltaproteobacteria bacterium CG17_big_fil_post_rev_8_21_14_2_50_63_7]
MPSQEICDGTDQDCNGIIDDPFDLQTDVDNCGVCGIACGSPSGGLCCSGLCRNSDVNNCGACDHTCTETSIFFSEIHVDPSGGGLIAIKKEYVELYNATNWDVDLRGFVLSDLDTDTLQINSSSPVIVPAQDYAVLVRTSSALENGGITNFVFVYGGAFQLGNTGDEAVLKAYTQELDRVVWPGTWDVNSASNELSLNHYDPALNDTLTNWCTATTPYGDGDNLGTPGLA